MMDAFDALSQRTIAAAGNDHLPARLLDCSPSEYHRLPGLSASIAKILNRRTALHAWDRFTRGNEQEIETDPKKIAQKERGTIGHALILGKGQSIVPVDAANWQTKAAKAQRGAIRDARNTPVLLSKLAKYSHAVGEIKKRIAALGHALDGVSEQAIEWHEPSASGPVLCRGMPDHMVFYRGGVRVALEDASSATEAKIYEVKIVDDASPDRNERSSEGMDYAIQYAAYFRGLNALYPRLAGRIEFRFLFCEMIQPYAVWDPTPDGSFDRLGNLRWERAVEKWGRCLRAKKWPGYEEHQQRTIGSPMWALHQEGIEDE